MNKCLFLFQFTPQNNNLNLEKSPNLGWPSTGDRKWEPTNPLLQDATFSPKKKFRLPLILRSYQLLLFYYYYYFALIHYIKKKKKIVFYVLSIKVLIAKPCVSWCDRFWIQAFVLRIWIFHTIYIKI